MLAQDDANSSALKTVQSQQDFSPSVPSNLVRHSRNRSLDSGVARRMMDTAVVERDLTARDGEEEKTTFNLEKVSSDEDHTPPPSDSDNVGEGEGGEGEDDDVVTLSGDVEEGVLSPNTGREVVSFSERRMSRAFREAVMSLLSVESSEVISEVSGWY